MHIPRVVGTLEPDKGRFPLLEAGVDQGHRVWRHILRLGDRFERPQHRARLVGPPSLRQDVRPQREGLLFSPENRAAVVNASSADSCSPSCSSACPAHHVPDPELRVEDDRLPSVVERRTIVARLERDLRGQRGHHRRERVELACAARRQQRLAVATHLRQQRVPEPGELCAESRVELSAHAGSPTRRAGQSHSQHHFRYARANCASAVSGPARTARTAASRARGSTSEGDASPLMRLAASTRRDRRPGQRVVWIQLGGTRVVPDRLSVGRRRALILEVATPKVQVVCIGLCVCRRASVSRRPGERRSRICSAMAVLNSCCRPNSSSARGRRTGTTPVPGRARERVWPSRATGCPRSEGSSRRCSRRRALVRSRPRTSSSPCSARSRYRRRPPSAQDRSARATWPCPPRGPRRVLACGVATEVGERQHGERQRGAAGTLAAREADQMPTPIRSAATTRPNVSRIARQTQRGAASSGSMGITAVAEAAGSDRGHEGLAIVRTALRRLSAWSPRRRLGTDRIVRPPVAGSCQTEAACRAPTTSTVAMKR